MAELLAGRTVFQGTSAADQLVRYAQVLGPPTARWPAARRLAKAASISLPALPRAGLASVLSKAGVRVSPSAAAACEALLEWDPVRRPTAQAALRMDFFASGPSLPLPLRSKSISAAEEASAARAGVELHARLISATAGASKASTSEAQSRPLGGAVYDDKDRAELKFELVSKKRAGSESSTDSLENEGFGLGAVDTEGTDT